MRHNHDALRLADALELCWGDKRIDEAAAELRRLHDLVTEDSILLRRQRDEIARLIARNSELVAALVEIEWSNDTAWQRDRARAALAKVEASK